jgi:hypothetical protein
MESDGNGQHEKRRFARRSVTNSRQSIWSVLDTRKVLEIVCAAGLLVLRRARNHLASLGGMSAAYFSSRASYDALVLAPGILAALEET